MNRRSRGKNDTGANLRQTTSSTPRLANPGSTYCSFSSSPTLLHFFPQLCCTALACAVAEFGSLSFISGSARCKTHSTVTHARSRSGRAEPSTQRGLCVAPSPILSGAVVVQVRFKRYRNKVTLVRPSVANPLPFLDCCQQLVAEISK